jgi:glycosyltransferase involved in cell wall biosynthesis
MRVLFLLEQLNRGGKERRLLEIIKGIKNNYPEVDIHFIISKAEYAFPEIFDLNVKIYQLDNPGNLRLLATYFRLIKKINPDIVHAWSYKTSFYASCLKPFYKYKLISGFIADVFGSDGVSALITQGLIFKFAENVIANSKAGLEAYKAPKHKSLVVYNGYDFKRNSNLKERDALKTELGIVTPYVVFMAGRISPHKDYRTFVAAARIIIEKRSDITFVSAGLIGHNDCYPEPLKEEEKTYIKFLGARNDIEDLINLCDIGLLCTFSEGVSNFILECMAQAKPVIATGIGGTAEIVDNHKSGFVLPASSPELVAEHIELLIGNNDLSKSFGEEGKRIVNTRFNQQLATESIYKLYNSLIYTACKP